MGKRFCGDFDKYLRYLPYCSQFSAYNRKHRLVNIVWPSSLLFIRVLSLPNSCLYHSKRVQKWCTNFGQLYIKGFKSFHSHIFAFKRTCIHKCLVNEMPHAYTRIHIQTYARWGVRYVFLIKLKGIVQLSTLYFQT